MLSLNTQVMETLRILNSDCVVQNISIHTDLSAALPDVMGDAVQIQQVLINLIRNAMQAMQKRVTGDRSIFICTSRGNEIEVQVRVEDTGLGIDPERLKDIFKPFTTSKQMGLGMGLSISRSIVKAHGGRIWAENMPAGGARVSFTLPVPEKKP